MVQSLLVFVCDSSYQALEYAAWSSQFTFLTRCFILTSERLDVKKLNWRKDSDIFLNLNNIINSKDKMDICFNVLQPKISKHLNAQRFKLLR